MGLKKWAAAALLLLPAGTAFASETPLYQDTPDWIVEAPLVPGEVKGSNASFLVYDDQQRIADGRLWHYVDTALRVSSPEMLSQLATIALQWTPDKGDLVVHEVSILRGEETIDVLAQEQKLEVLRREENLEQRELTGILTATMAVEDLRVGDVLRIRHSTTLEDAALDGNVQSVVPVLAAPLRLGFGRMRALWPKDAKVHWQVLASDVSAQPARKNGQMELVMDLPAPKQPEMPADAPARFRRVPMFELSTFASWQDVSSIMAAHYDTDGLIAPGSPLAREVVRITADEATRLGRAQSALRLVQDQIRYLAVGMEGGNYIPQTPSETWRLRYGDCKAKTLLLLALLHAMDIEAEAVLASSELGDLIPERIPSAAAFDHVLVRARIDGQTLWLDGTGSGARIEDIHDTPKLGTVLPLRMTGSVLTEIETHRNARPTVDIRVEADESTSVDLPSVYDATLVLRGPAATGLSLAAANLDEEKQKELVEQLLTRAIGESQFSDVSLDMDAASATATLKAHGITTTPWQWTEKRSERRLGRALSDFTFEPDRTRAEWSDIPVSSPDPQGMRYRLTLRLPDGGEGYVLEGPRQTQEALAGHVLERSIAIEDGILTLTERIDSTGVEIPVERLGAQRDKVATAKARQPKLIAPGDAVRRWNLDDAPESATQFDGALSAYDKAIEAHPDKPTPLLSRAIFNMGVGEFRAARSDLTKALAISVDKDLYLRRAAGNQALNDLPAALADARKARELDPSSQQATALVARILAEQGKIEEATALLDERIALGGDTKDDLRETKAAIVGEFGDPAKALALVEDLMEAKPGSPSLLNASCWIKGTRAVQVDSALKECTSAIELSPSPYGALDSRSVIWFRLGRFEEALRDLNAVLDQAPNLAESRYMRGIVLARLDRHEESADDIRIAERLNPRISDIYERFGIVP